MSGWYLDTSVLVAILVGQHPHHARAVSVLDEATKQGARLWAAGHGLMESYSVLTRTPFRPPIYPAEAWRLLENLARERIELVSLDSAEYIRLVADCAERGDVGGRVYDALQVQCAMKCGSERLYTFNARDFGRLMPADWQTRLCMP